jgi:hypothetical protein
MIHVLDRDQAREECNNMGLTFSHSDPVETLRGKLRQADLSKERPEEFGTEFNCGLEAANCEFLLANIIPPIIPLLDSDDSWGQEYANETRASAIRLRDRTKGQIPSPALLEIVWWSVVEASTPHTSRSTE